MPGVPIEVFVFFGVFWTAMTVVWTPFLGAASVRRLFEGWPTDRLGVNYALGMGAFTFVHLGAVAVAFVAVAGPGTGGVNLLEAFRLALGVTAGVLVVAWVGASVGLPRVGAWSPTGEGYDGRLVLAGGALWYGVCTLLVAAFLSLVAFAFAFPG